MPIAFLKKNNQSSLVVIILLSLSTVTFAGVFFLTVYFFDFCRSLPGQGLSALPAVTLDNNQESGDEQKVEVTSGDPSIAQVVKQVSKHLALPDGEVLVATVLDPETFGREHAGFFVSPKKGDKVLVYADRVILYDPDRDRLLDIIHAALPGQAAGDRSVSTTSP